MSAVAESAAVLTKASGQIYVERQGARLPLQQGDNIEATDTVITANDGTAEVRFADGSTASLSPDSSLEVKAFAFGEGVEPSFILNLAQGTMRSVSGEVVKQNPDAFKIVTPQATVGIRGTELFTAVQPGGQEVHAVLHIGKDHIVTITGRDGQSVVMDQALQAVNMQGDPGAMGSNMVKQTYKLTEMQQVIQSIAPSQTQQPIRPQGEQGEQTKPGAEGTDGADAASAPVAASQSAVVVITYESDAASTVQTAATASDVNTLISVVDHLQGALADAGFSVQVAGDALGLPGLGLDNTGITAVPDAGSASDMVSQIIAPPTNAPTTPEAPTVPDAPAPVLPIDYTYNGFAASDTPTHLDQQDGTRPLNITINGDVSGTFYANADTSMTAGSTTGDVIRYGSISGGSVSGDIGGTSTVTATGDITFGNDLIVGGNLTSGTITGDILNVNSGGNTITYGNDTITVNGNVANGKIYGDYMGAGNNSQTHLGGHDSITVTGNVSGNTSVIDGGHGDDIITIKGNVSGGSILGGTGNDTIRIEGALAGGTNVEGDNSASGAPGGNDFIYINKVDTASGTTARVDSGLGADTIIIGSKEGAGALTVDLGRDVDVDKLKLNLDDNTTGNVTINNYNAGDIIDFGSLTGWTPGLNGSHDIFTLTKGGVVITLTGTAISGITGDADTIYRQLVDNLGTVTG